MTDEPAKRLAYNHQMAWGREPSRMIPDRKSHCHIRGTSSLEEVDMHVARDVFRRSKGQNLERGQEVGRDFKGRKKMVIGQISHESLEIDVFWRGRLLLQSSQEGIYNISTM